MDPLCEEGFYNMQPSVQYDFSGGMNLFADDINLAANEYGVSFNVRNREAGLSPVKAAILDTGLPKGKKQGLYAFDRYVITFVNGYAYYKDIILNGVWTKIADLVVDPTVERIYVQVVPSSTFDFRRVLKVVTQVTSTATTSSVNNINIITTPTQSGLVVQDGVNQPWIIFSDATARRIQTYAKWAYDPNTLSDAREYVPIMKQMIFVGNSLLIGISPDGKTIYRSVSGRPLDFVVNVDVNGNKGGDATTTSHAIGYDIINCIATLDSGDILVGSEKRTTILSLDYEQRIFDEPTFDTKQTFAVGVVNQFSFLDTLRIDGNSFYYFVDFDGMRTFGSGTLDDQNEGRNSIFTSNIHKALVSKQTDSCGIVFDNYSLFSVKTKYSDLNLVIVYDNLRQQWVSIDNYGLTGSIKQFAVAAQSSSPSLYAITTDDKLYQIFGSDSYVLSDASFKATVTGLASVQLKLSDIRTIFSDGVLTGTVTASDYTDSRLSYNVIENLDGRLIENKRFNFNRLASVGWKISPRIKWKTDARLSLVEVNTLDQNQKTPINQQISRYASDN